MDIDMDKNSDSAFLYHTITIPLQAFLTGFYYELDLFGKIIQLVFKDLYKNNLLYKLSGYGMLLSTKEPERGDLIFKIELEQPTPNRVEELKLIELPIREGYKEVEVLNWF